MAYARDLRKQQHSLRAPPYVNIRQQRLMVHNVEVRDLPVDTRLCQLILNSLHSLTPVQE